MATTTTTRREYLNGASIDADVWAYGGQVVYCVAADAEPTSGPVPGDLRVRTDSGVVRRFTGVQGNLWINDPLIGGSSSGGLVPGDLGVAVTGSPYPLPSPGAGLIGYVSYLGTLLIARIAPLGVQAAANSTSVTIDSDHVVSGGVVVNTLPLSSDVDNVAAVASGNVAHDGVDSGNPVKGGAVAYLATAPAAVSTNADRANNIADGQGRLFVRQGHQALISDVFNIEHRPSSNTQATITQAAPGAGKRLVITSITARLVAGTTAPAAIQVAVTLVNDTGGSATEQWSTNMALTATAGDRDGGPLSNLWIPAAAANKDMRLRFEAAGGSNTFESVTLGGVIIQE